MKYPVGTRITGKVRNLTSFGAFVEIEPGIDGLVHISDMSWTRRVQHPSEVMKKGDTVEVVILNIDPDSKRISLGLKQAQDDPWLKIGQDYPVGTDLEGRIVRVLDNTVIVDIGNDIEGLIPASQFPVPDNRKVEDVAKDGSLVDVKVMEVDPIHHKIVLAATSQPREAPPSAQVEEAPAMEMESDTEDEVEEPARPEEPTATAE
jgi:small subunit ribosomal protein S1